MFASRRDRYRDLEVWSSGNWSLEYDAGRDREWALVAWSDAGTEISVYDDAPNFLENFIEYISRNRFLTPIEMAGLLITLTNLGHLS